MSRMLPSKSYLKSVIYSQPVNQYINESKKSHRVTLPSVRLLRRRLYAVDSQIQSQFRFDAPPISLIDVEYHNIKFAPNN